MSDPVDFGTLHFTDATIGSVNLEGQRLTLLVKNIIVMDGDVPKHMINSSELVFEGVSASRRIIVPYQRSPKHRRTLPEQTIVDVEGPPAPGSTEYFIEGLLEQPSAWVQEWLIHATSFSLHPRP